MKGLGTLAGVGNPPTLTSPDAALLRLCVQHGANLAAYNAIGGQLPPDQPDPLREAYMRTCAAIGDARPETMAGVLAKACAAKVEAFTTNVADDPSNSPAAAWAWDIVGDLLRLYGEGGEA